MVLNVVFFLRQGRVQGLNKAWMIRYVFYKARVLRVFIYQRDLFVREGFVVGKIRVRVQEYFSREIKGERFSGERQGFQNIFGRREISQLEVRSWGIWVLIIVIVFFLFRFTFCCFCFFSVSIVGNFNRQCLFCDLVDNCIYFSVFFSYSMDFFLFKCEGKFLLAFQICF